MNPQPNPNPLYVYEVLDDESYDIELSSDDYLDGDQFDLWWERVFDAINQVTDDEEDLETIWGIYTRTEKKRQREEIENLPSMSSFNSKRQRQF